MMIVMRRERKQGDRQDPIKRLAVALGPPPPFTSPILLEPLPFRDRKLTRAVNWQRVSNPT